MLPDCNHDMYGLVLAAGKGTRMKSARAKVLHEVFFSPMVHYVINALIPLSMRDIIVVTGHQGHEVEECLSHYKVRFARQENQRGTGDAVLATRSLLAGKTGFALIVCGDTPLISSETLRDMIAVHTSNPAPLTVMTTHVEDPAQYGRIISNQSGTIDKIVEEKDASPDERMIREINAGIYCVDIPFLYEALSHVGTNNKQGEFYLTDIVGIATQSNYSVNKFVCSEPSEVIGVNSRVDLARVSKVLQLRRNAQLMVEGVTMVDPDSTYVDYRASVACDTILYPNVFLSGKTVVEQGCVILPYVTLQDYHLAANSTVESFSHFKGKFVD